MGGLKKETTRLPLARAEKKKKAEEKKKSGSSRGVLVYVWSMYGIGVVVVAVWFCLWLGDEVCVGKCLTRRGVEVCFGW